MLASQVISGMALQASILRHPCQASTSKLHHQDLWRFNDVFLGRSGWSPDCASECHPINIGIDSKKFPIDSLLVRGDPESGS